MSLQARQWSIEASKYAWREPSEKLGCVLRGVYSVFGALPRSGRLNLLWMRKTREKTASMFLFALPSFQRREKCFFSFHGEEELQRSVFSTLSEELFSSGRILFSFFCWELCFFASDLRTRVADFYGYSVSRGLPCLRCKHSETLAAQCIHLLITSV